MEIRRSSVCEVETEHEYKNIILQFRVAWVSLRPIQLSSFRFITHFIYEWEIK